MYKEEVSKEEIKIPHVAMLEDIFRWIDEGRFSCEEDEVVVYYFDEHDKSLGKTCVSTQNQLMYLYKQAMI